MTKKKVSPKKDCWQNLGDGTILNPGNSVNYKTGKWGAKKLNFCAKNCISCGMCWPVCPDEAIIYKDGKMVGVDLDFCKSCGLCVSACPTTKNKDKSKHALFFENK